MGKEWFEFLTTTVAGLSHHVSRADLDLLSQGQVLHLYRERDNPHDADAVQVRRPEDGALLGYVPRVQARAIAALMDNGYLVHCNVDGVHPTHHQVTVALSLESKN